MLEGVYLNAVREDHKEVSLAHRGRLHPFKLKPKPEPRGRDAGEAPPLPLAEL